MKTELCIIIHSKGKALWFHSKNYLENEPLYAVNTHKGVFN
jgi:hypothetical protein